VDATRQATAGDADALLALKLALDRESSFMMLEPDERATTAAESEDELRAILARPNSVVLVAEAARELVGCAEASGGEFRRNRHTASVVGRRPAITVRQRNRSSAVDRARNMGAGDRSGPARAHRDDTQPAGAGALPIAGLCESLGYEIEGTRRSGLVVENQPVDEYWIAKLLAASAFRRQT
jgi:hypothetical protein